MSTEQTEKCGQYFQADTALCFKCGMPKGHKGSHGWCSQDVLTAARDVAAERITIPASSSPEGASLAARVKELEANREFSQQGIDTLEQRLAEVTRHLTEAQTSGWCDVCCGTGKPTADVPCMCGGTGLAADAVIHLRERLFKVEKRAEAAEATIATLAKLPAKWRAVGKATTSTAGIYATGVEDGMVACADKLDAALAAPAAPAEIEDAWVARWCGLDETTRQRVMLRLYPYGLAAPAAGTVTTGEQECVVGDQGGAICVTHDNPLDWVECTGWRCDVSGKIVKKHETPEQESARQGAGDASEGGRMNQIMVDRDVDLRREMRAYLDTLTITGDNIGNIRRELFVPWESAWNGWVREDTADREKPSAEAAGTEQTAPAEPRTE